jgi:hypothetical protein
MKPPSGGFFLSERAGEAIGNNALCRVTQKAGKNPNGDKICGYAYWVGKVKIRKCA